MDSSKEKLRVKYESIIEEKEFDNKKYPFEAPACYGMGSVIRKMASFPKNWPLAIDTDHGPSQRDEPTYLERLSNAPLMLYHSKRLVKEWEKNSKKPVSGYFSPFAYYRRTLFTSQKTKHQGTLAFPAHSTDLIDASFGQQEYVDQLKRLPEQYHPIDICLYYKDINKGYHKFFLDNGFAVYCAGHIYDNDFIKNFYSLLSDYSYTTSNSLGSYLFYSIEMDIPFFIYGPSVVMINRGDPNCEEGTYNPYELYSQMKRGYELFKPQNTNNIEIKNEQREFVRAELGFEFNNRLKLAWNVYKAWFYFKLRKLTSNPKREIKLVIKKPYLMIVTRISDAKKKIISRYKRFLFEKDLKVFTHLTEEEKYLLHKVAAVLPKSASAAEIGSYLGSSSCFIARGLKKDSRLYCIDTWGNHAMKYDETDTDANERDTYKEFLVNTSVYKNKIITLRGWSYDVLPELRKHTESLDFLFIDGDHNYDGVKKDWSLYSPFLKKGSFVAFHDTGWAEGVQKVVAEEVEPNAQLWQKLPNLSVYKII